jgi:hypothetical protein
MMLREGIQDYEKIRILKALFQSSDQVKLQALNTILRKFTAASGEDYPESLINEGQEMLATLSHDMAMPAGIKRIHSESGKLKIYPNPASDYIHIKIPDGQTIFSIRFFSASGRVVNIPRNGSSGDLHTFSVNNISKGIYFVHVVTKERTYRGVFIV